MTRAVWIVAGALLVCGAARAEDQPGAPVTDFSRALGPRVAPTAPAAPTASPAEKPTQSPEALACASSDGKVSAAQREEACSILIDQRKWTGKEIAWAYANRCGVRYRLKQLERALADCSEAIDQDPDQANAYQLRAEIHRKRDNRAKALEDYDKAVALGVKSAVVFAGRGLLHLLDGDGAKALADFDQEVAIAGGADDSWMDRGSAWLSLGENAKAEQDFAKATELAPKNAQAWLNSGRRGAGRRRQGQGGRIFRRGAQARSGASLCGAVALPRARRLGAGQGGIAGLGRQGDEQGLALRGGAALSGPRRGRRNAGGVQRRRPAMRSAFLRRGEPAEEGRGAGGGDRTEARG